MLLINRPFFKPGCSDRIISLFRALVIVFLLLLSNSGQAQTDTWGREFYLSLFPNPGPFNPPRGPSRPRAFLYFYTEEESTVEVTFGKSDPLTYNLSPGGRTVEISTEDLEKITATKKNAKNGRASIHIVSDNKIQVTISHHDGYSMDATTAMPITSGGHHYMLSSWVDATRANIVNTGGRTVVRIIPGNDPDGVPYGEETAVLLEEGEVYSIYGHNLSGYEIIASKNENDLILPGLPPSGDVIENLDCDPLMVYAGNEQGILSPCYSPSPRSHMLEAVAPIVTAGKEFVMIPFYDRINTNHRAVVVGLDADSTLVERTIWYNDTFSRTILDTIGRGEYAVYASIHPMVIKAKKPIIASQLQFNQDGCNLNWQPGEGYGGPMQIDHPSFDQATDKAKVFVSRMLDIEKYYFNITIRDEDVPNFTISPSVPDLEFIELNGTGYSFASVQVSPNREYTLEAPDGKFLVTEYGLGLGRSYGRNPYREINNLNFDLTIDDDEIGEVKDDACLNSVLTFDIDFLKPGLSDDYNKIEWDFGDGETFEGKTFEKTYDEAGLYRISCTLSTAEDKCITIHTLYREIEIHEIVAERVEGPISLCPYTKNIEYTLINDGGYIYDWEVEGGTIAGSSSGESIIVNWGGVNENAKVTVYVSNEYGCTVEPLYLDLSLESTDQLQPGPAFGNEEVCYTDRDYQIYYTPDITGATFEWVVEGGEIISGQDTHEIVVEWKELQGKLYYILNLNHCYGASPELNVIVYDELEPILTPVDVRCNDNGDGTASVAISGGKIPYTITWSNGDIGTSAKRLTPGNYKVLIEDAIGCQKELEFSIDEPPPMSVEAFSRKYCNGEPDGEISIIAKGGVAPYTYHLYGSLVGNDFDKLQDSPEFENLYAGRYTLVVTDANHCTFNLTVDVDDLPLLELELKSNQPVCPGETNGEIRVLASGGVEPYQYEWNDNTQGELLSNIGTGDYEVSVTDANGCVATLTVTKEELFSKMLFPNSFTPNGDGVNDFFAPISPCIPDYNMTIYDRWGKVVYQQLQDKGVWDGTMDGEDMPAETYVYYVSYDLTNSAGTYTENVRGYVKLIR